MQHTDIQSKAVLLCFLVLGAVVQDVGAASLRSRSLRSNQILQPGSTVVASEVPEGVDV